MANILNGFLNNVFQGALNPGGNLKDYQHASRLFVDDGMRLAPKTKFLYHCVFELSDEAQKVIPQLDQRHKQEINMLVKSVDLPKFSIQTATKNMYNRKKNLQTSIEYDPVNITFHDDNMGLTTTLMEAYYRFYFRDGNHRGEGVNPPYNPRNTYGNSIQQNYRYGLDNDHKTPFFNKITIYQMARHEYLGYTLVNPMITGLTHDQMDSADNNTPSQNQISIAYEAVFYSRGPVGENSPKGFATAHYDKTPSPLTIGGGGTSSLFGGGGVLGGISDVLGDIAGGQFNLGTALTAFNTFKNAKSLTKEGLREEGFNILKGAITNIGKENVGGLSNINIPKSSGNGGSASVTNTNGGAVNTSSAIYSDRIMQAAANNNTSAGVSSSNSLEAFGGAGANVGTSTSVGSSSGSTLQAERNGP